MEFIAQLNERARADPQQFAVTLCTGRQEPYVEALMQAIDAHMPAIYENGGGLYFPSGYRFLENPDITPQMRASLGKIRRVLLREIVATGLGRFQPGKEVSLTLYPARPALTFEQLAELARRALAEKLDGYSILASVSTVEILPQGIDKGAGVEWLSREIGIPLAQMGGIGDAPSDLSYLRKVGYSATTANAQDMVKGAVGYVSPYEDSLGTFDILRHWLQSD